MDPIHGEDYLVDYYALLSVQRTASKDEIAQAYRSQQKLYHPDRFQGLAPELAGIASRKSRLLNEAYAELADDARRQAYDTKLAEWTKPLSTDGTPILSLDGKGYSYRSLLRSLNGSSQEIEAEMEKLALQFSGFDKATYEFFLQHAGGPDGIPQGLQAAYLEQLQRRDLYLTLREGFMWERIGMKNHDETPELELVEQTYRRIGRARENARKETQVQVQLLAQGKVALLAAPEGMDVQADPSALQELLGNAIAKHIDTQAVELETIAKEREDIINKRFLIQAQVTYHPLSVIATPKLIVEILHETAGIVLPFEFVSEKTVTGMKQDVKANWSPETVPQWIAQGFSVVSFVPVQGIDFMSQLRRVIELHGEKLEAN